MVKRVTIALFVICSIISQLDAYHTKITFKKNKVIEKIEFGQINWTDGIITIYGEKKLSSIFKDGPKLKEKDKYSTSLAEARLKAKKEALEDARQNLYNALINLRIKNKYYIKSYLINATNDFKYNLNEVVDNNISKKYIYIKNGIRVKVTLKLFGKDGLITIFTKKYNPAVVEFNKIKTISNTNDSSQIFTSLIIDASELKLYPALFPALYSQQGKEVLSSRTVKSDKIIDRGLVTYIADINRIKKIDFIDSNAFIIKALKTRNITDIILPQDEIKRFLSNHKTIEALNNCHVVIILNR